MRTTLDIDPEALAEALEATGERSRSSVVNLALRNLIRHKRIEEFRAVVGEIGLANNLNEIDELERDEEKEHGW